MLTQKYIDVNYEIESTVKFDGMKLSLITFYKRDPQIIFVPTLHISIVIEIITKLYFNHIYT